MHSVSFPNGIAQNRTESAFPELWDGLVLHYDPNVGKTALKLRNYAQNRYHGTFNNMNVDAWERTARGYALKFDDTDDSISLGSSIPFIRGNCFTFMCWMKGPSQPRGMMIARETGTDPDVFMCTGESTADKLRLFVNNGSSSLATETTATICDNKWHHVAGKFDGGTTTLYVDGKIDTTNSGAVTLGTSNGLRLGANGPSGANFYSGYLTDVRVYSRTLSDAEVALSFSGASPLTPRAIPSLKANAAASVSSIPWHHFFAEAV